MNREFKVGLAVFIALLALGAIVFFTGGALLRHGGNIYEISFPDAMGLEEGAPVYVSGVESGAVRSMRLSSEGVLINVVLDPNVALPKDSRILIGTGGLLGTPVIRVERGSSPDFYSTGEKLVGETPPDFDSVLEELRVDLKMLKETFGHFNEIFGDPGRKKKLAAALDGLPELVRESRTAVGRIKDAGEEVRHLGREARNEIKVLSKSLARLSGDLDKMVVDNEAEIRASISSLRTLLGRLEKAFLQFDEDEMSGADLREAVTNISRAAQGIENLSRNLSEALGDNAGDMGSPGRATSLKQAIKSAEKIIKAVDAIEYSGEVSIHGGETGRDGEDWLMNFSFLVGREDSPWGFLAGVNDLGNGSAGTASIAYRAHWGRVWGGLVRGDVGVGALLDLRPSKIPLSVAAEWWDDQGGSWAATGRWHFGKSWGLFYERLEPGEERARDTYGVFYQF